MRPTDILFFHVNFFLDIYTFATKHDKVNANVTINNVNKRIMPVGVRLKLIS